MKLALFKENYTNWLREQAATRVALPLLVIVVLILALALTNKRETIVVVPPDLPQGGFNITEDSASDSFHRTWGHFFAHTFGNLTPANLDFVLGTLERYFSPTIFNQLALTLTEQAEIIRFDRITMTFSPKTVTYEPDTGRTFVTGLKRITGITGEVKELKMTYEFMIGVDLGSPVILDYNLYEGHPQLLQEKLQKRERERISKMQAAAEAKAKGGR